MAVGPQPVLHLAYGQRVESSESAPQPEDYVQLNGFRLVKPYHFDFVCNVRQRWAGQTILDIFCREFPARDRQYYQQALADGHLRVEGALATPDTRVKEGQRMRHFIHRHEPPVIAGPIQVVAVSEEVVAVNKPAGIPVHVAGQYRKNTVHGVLTAERPELGPLLPVHRLDKPVSGLLLFARTPAAANVLRERIMGGEMEKVYVARVAGRFPESEGPIVVDVPMSWDPITNHATAVPPSNAAAAVRAVAAEAEGPAPSAHEAASELTGVAAESHQQEHKQHGQQGQHERDSATCIEAEGQQEQQQQVTQGQPEPGPDKAPQQQEEQHQEGQQQQEFEPGAVPGPISKSARKQQRRAELRAAAQSSAAAGGGGRAAKAAADKHGPKAAVTEFRLLSVAPDGKTSLVECRPRTGRTHQIRVHLQWLGHPIANDTQYGGRYSGPQASRELAIRMGVSWEAKRAGAAAASAAATAAAAAAGSGGRAQAGGGAAAAAAAAAAAVVAAARGGGMGGDAALTGDAVQGAAATAAADGADAAAAGRPGSSDGSGASEGCKRPRLEVPQAGGGPASSSMREGNGAGQQQQQQQQQLSLEEDEGVELDLYAQNRAFRSQQEYMVGPELRDALCVHCPFHAPKDYPLDLRPLWLHARSYSCAAWSHSAPPPAWADPAHVPPEPAQ